MLVVALVFVLVVLYAAKIAGPESHELKPQADETGREEIERDKITK